MEGENGGNPPPVGAGGTTSTLKLQPPVLDLNVERYAAFKSWKEKWEDYVLLSNLDQQDKKKQAAMLRYTFSADTRKIYNSLGLTDEQKEEPDQIIAELEKFSKGTINEILERHVFNNRTQEDGEKFDDFLTELKVLSTNCNYCVNCYPGILRDRVVEGIQSDTVKEKLIAERTLTLDTAVEKCRAFELAADGMKTISKSNNNNVDRVGDHRDKGGKFEQRSNKGNNSEPKDCKFCLKKHKWGRSFCPAYGKPCNTCKKPNHFSGSSMCSSSGGDDNSREADGVETDNTASSVNASEGYMQVMFMGSIQATVVDEENDQNGGESMVIDKAAVEMLFDEISQQVVQNEVTQNEMLNQLAVLEEILAQIGERNEISMQVVDEIEEKVVEKVVVEVVEEILYQVEENDEVSMQDAELPEYQNNMYIHFTNSNVVDDACTDQVEDEELQDEEMQDDSAINKSRQERRSDERFTRKLINKIMKHCQKEAKINAVEEAEVKDIDDDFYIRIKAGRGDVRLKIDTGADVTVIRPDNLHLFGLTQEDLKPTRKTLRAASGTELVCHGYFVRKLRFNNKVASMHGYVCENVQLNLLGKPELKKLEVLKLNNLEDVDSCSTEDKEPEHLKFPRLFNSLGRISGDEIDIKLDMKGKEPYHLTCPRRVAVPLLKGLEAELNRMESMGVIKKITEPTDWCHPIVLVEKPESHEIRICLDLTKLNQCVKREYYQLPSVDETLAKIGKKGKIFSNLMLTQVIGRCL